jgi:hypothetical protein
MPMAADSTDIIANMPMPADSTVIIANMHMPADSTDIIANMPMPADSTDITADSRLPCTSSLSTRVFCFAHIRWFLNSCVDGKYRLFAQRRIGAL